MLYNQINQLQISHNKKLPVDLHTFLKQKLI